MHEKRVGLSKRSKKVNSFTASNNQLLFNLLTVLSTLLLLHIHDALGMCLWVMCWMRGKNGGLQAIVAAELLELSYVTRETMFDKNRQCDECLSPCCICMVWGCCTMKIGWVRWVWAMKNWWVHRCCGDVHGCRWFFLMPVDLLFGNISIYPHDTKNGQRHATT